MQLVGIGLIMSSCTLAGFAYDGYEGKRVKQLEQLLMGFEVIRAEIDYQLTPLGEALERASEMTNDGVNELFANFAEKLAQNNDIDTKRMWYCAIDDSKRKLSLKDEDYKVLETFGTTVGMLDKEMQKKNIDWVLSRLAQKKDVAQAMYERKSKLYRGLGVLVGLSISIVLI
ncbi:MAG: hypothetical protein ATN33_06650 [Epulopiscium sp. Nele67-Bin001]|nr:MAG: hypothetical protein BEN18_06050 [Epulopiscium sp. Nuni2H_MBin001]OON92794.1 MAG: hypothetical protein ATN33_06650 [Epulopiscium sp. Nele67-Bin001]